MANEYQNRLSELLKKKGIGPAGSKSLKEEELEEVAQLLRNQEVSLTTKATIITALLLLEPTQIESEFLDKVKSNADRYLPERLLAFLQDTCEDPFLNLVLKNIRKEDLSAKECFEAMSYFFGNSEPYIQAAFLEAQRLKRETFVENDSFFKAFWKESQRVETQLPQLVDISNNYDGNIRTKNYSLLTAKLLAKAKVPTLIHGLQKVAPKNGLTLYMILQELGYDPLVSLSDAKSQLEQNNWVYVDQQMAFPKLFDKVQMREEMVKRPFIATFEKLMQPICSVKGNLVVTGYTHKHYKQEVPKLLKAQGKCEKALVVKGEEGSAQLPLHKASEYVLFDGKTIIEGTISPEEFGISMLNNTDKSEINAENVIQDMQNAVLGTNDYVKWLVIYNAAAIIKSFDLDRSKDMLNSLEMLFHQIEL